MFLIWSAELWPLGSRSLRPEKLLQEPGREGEQSWETEERVLVRTVTLTAQNVGKALAPAPLCTGPGFLHLENGGHQSLSFLDYLLPWWMVTFWIRETKAAAQNHTQDPPQGHPQHSPQASYALTL